MRQLRFLLPHAGNVLDFEHLTQLHQSLAILLQSELEKSTCPERKVSASIIGIRSYYFDILAVATNGAPVGSLNLPLSLHKRVCVHAEDRAIHKLPMGLQGYLMVSYSSLAPCYDCSIKLSNAGIRAHVYFLEYDDPTGLEHLLNEGIPVYKFTTFGRLIPLHLDARLRPILLNELQD